jgi:hypothetical protein
LRDLFDPTRRLRPGSLQPPRLSGEFATGHSKQDEHLIADVLAMMLEDAGYDVASAAHGKAALALARENSPALVITDFMRPL